MPVVGFWDTRQGGRAENQDSCGFIDTPLGLVAIVCDGMGGGPAGQLASSTAVKKIVEYIMKAPEDLKRTEIMKNAVEYAHHCLLEMVNDNPRIKGMGTTVASVLINNDSVIIAHVGDSRVYQFRRGRKIFRTEDHSFVGQLVRDHEISEERARLHPQSNLLLKALGGNLNDLADVIERPYEAGDRFLICTDGIWGMLPEKELIYKTAKIPSIAGAVDGTILEVDELGRNNGNTHDNMTIVLLETKHNSKLKEKMSKQTLHILLLLSAVCLISIVTNIVLLNKLNQPSEAEQKVEELTQQVKEKDLKIQELQNKVDTLRDIVAKSQQETVNARMAVADERAKAAQRAQEEAERKAKEADAVAERAAASARQTQKTTINVSAQVNGVIKKLTEARDMKENDTRKKLRQQAYNELKALIAKDPRNKTIYGEVMEKVNNSRAKEATPSAKRHYNLLIQKLRNIK